VCVSVNLAIYTTCKSSVSVNVNIYLVAMYIYIYIHLHKANVNICQIHLQGPCVNVLGHVNVSVKTKIICKVTIFWASFHPKPFF